jgi:hypothetical protein
VEQFFIYGGFPFKAKADAVINDAVADFKTTSAISKTRFINDCLLMYQRQAFLYMTAFQVQNFYFLGIPKNPKVREIWTYHIKLQDIDEAVIAQLNFDIALIRELNLF